MIGWILGTIAIVVLMFVLSGIRIVRPTERAVIETLGKYSGFAKEGFNWVIPIFQRLIEVNTTERMAQIESQEIITEDKLNASVDLVVYYKVKKDEESIKRSLYEVNNFRDQIIILAQTTARNVIGEMEFKDVNSKRKDLNSKLARILSEETNNWGVDIVRVELKDITPPRNVQDIMNSVINAENAKRAAIDMATARETEADGLRRAKIKEAEGEKQACILKAEGQAKAFDLINKSFTGNAQILRQFEVTENSLKNNAKIILSEKGITPQLLIGNLPFEGK
jgi:regulator of protease activity HflC (stomatin/prohibitin superfamily)